MANHFLEYDRHAFTRPCVHISHITMPCQEEGDADSRFHLCVRLCYVRGRHGHTASHLTARSHADTHITHRVAPSCACPGRPHRKPPTCRKGSRRRRTTRRDMDHHARTHCHRLYVYRQHRDRVDLTAARLVDDAHVTTRRATACDCISILSRTGPKIPQVLQQPVCDRSEWNHRRRTSKNSYIACGIGGLVDPRNSGGRHFSSSIHTCWLADLCGCVYIGDCQKPAEPRGTTTGLIGRLGAWPAWPERRMGAMHQGHGAPPLGVQSDRAGQDSRFSSSRKCGGQGREASAVLVFGTFGDIRNRVGCEHTDAGEAGLSDPIPLARDGLSG